MIKPSTSVAAWILGLGVIVSPAIAQHDSYETAAAEGEKPSDFTLSNLPPLKAAGIDATIWAWLTYARSSEGDPKYSWGAELELDLSKTIANRVTFSADIEFIDYDDLMRGELEQLYVNIRLAPESRFMLTLGKFNSPFGVEGRDFWDRSTGTPTLLFRAQPQDLRGVMLTAPVGDTGVSVKPFVVNGFNDEDSIPGRPAAGLMVEYKPNRIWTVGVTGWWAPGLKSQQQQVSGDGTADGGYYIGDVYYPPVNPITPTPAPIDKSLYASSVFGLTNTWENPDYNSSHDGHLYFLDATVTWKPRKNLILAAEYLLVSSDAEGESLFWDGIGLIASYDIDRHWRAFGHYSYLNDRDGVVSGVDQNLQAIGVGAGFRVNRYIELRAEYRHDFSDETEDVDSVSVHASFWH